MKKYELTLRIDMSLRPVNLPASIDRCAQWLNVPDWRYVEKRFGNGDMDFSGIPGMRGWSFV